MKTNTSMTTSTSTFWHVSASTNNSKLGRMVSTTSSQDTCPPSCPPSCPLADSGCYAKAGPMGMHWLAVNKGKRGTSSIQQHTDEIRSALLSYPVGTRTIRLNQAGDLPGAGEDIDADALEAIRKAIEQSKGIGWTYTHKTSSKALEAVLHNNAQNLYGPKVLGSGGHRYGLTVNVSTDTPQQAERLHVLGFPVVLTVPEETPESGRLPGGTPYKVCPAQLEGRAGKGPVTCTTCRLCALDDPRRPVVAFRVHGISRKRLTVTLAQLQALEDNQTVQKALAGRARLLSQPLGTPNGTPEATL